ncbi:hypothetical protein C8R47DRAFT_1168222, partial [Mycena vitilis]
MLESYLSAGYLASVMVFDINHKKIVFDEVLTFRVLDTDVNMKLRGIMYGGQSHFICRMVGKDGKMWFHDGITTGRD